MYGIRAQAHKQIIMLVMDFIFDGETLWVFRSHWKGNIRNKWLEKYMYFMKSSGKLSLMRRKFIVDWSKLI